MSLVDICSSRLIIHRFKDFTELFLIFSSFPGNCKNMTPYELRKEQERQVRMYSMPAPLWPYHIGYKEVKKVKRELDGTVLTTVEDKFTVER